MKIKVECKYFCFQNQSFISQRWLTWNLSLYYPYIIQQVGNENILTYLVEAAILI